MALHTTLTIYKVAYGLLRIVTELTANFPRNYRATIGEQIRNLSLEIVTLIGRANAAENKAPHLTKVLELVGVLEVLIRLAQDMRLISIGQYAQAIERTTSIGKQANGWKGSQKRV